MRLHLTLLGEPKFMLDGAPLTGFISMKAQALLIYLAVIPGLHSRDTLATLFWDEMPEAAAKKNLTKALSNLRKLTGDYVMTDTQSAGLNSALPSWIDVHPFVQTVEMATPNPDPQLLHEAMALYQGEFLQGFYAKDAPIFEEWVRGERERLHQMALRGLYTLAERWIAAGEDANVIDCLQRLLTFDPLHESAHLQLMQALARSGQRSAALAQYELCCRLLAEELGAQPSSELRTAYERIKRRGAPTPHNLPALGGFVGRAVELAELTELLGDPVCRLLTIVGPGGIGKSRLALQMAMTYTATDSDEHASHPFPDGIYFIALASHSTINTVLTTIADVLGFPLQGREEPHKQLMGYLRNKAMLLVLDNFEQLLPSQGQLPTSPSRSIFEASPSRAISFVTSLLDHAPEIKVLISSRIRLAIQREHVLHLSGMEVPTTPATRRSEKSAATTAQLLSARFPIAVHEALAYSSVQLFVQSAARLRPDFTLTTGNINAIIDICRRVQGTPLGILLAAAWITVLTPNEILHELESNLDLLETQEHDVPSRQRSVRATFDYTWNMLSPRDQDVFKKLVIFRGSFTRQAAQQVSGASLRELMTMVDKSLLMPAEDGRFGMHELLRQFGVEKLEETPALAQAARDQHCTYYSRLMAQRGQEYIGPQQQQALSETEVDGENIRTAWQWAVGQRYVPQLAQCVDGICQFYVWRGRFQDGATLVQSAMSALLSASPVPFSLQELRLQVELAIWQGIFAHLLGREEEAQQRLHDSLQLLMEPPLVAEDVRLQQAFALLHLGNTLRETDRALARQQYEQSLALYRATEYSWGVANALDALGWLIQHWGGYREARRLYQESLTIRQQLGDQRGLATALRAVGGVALYQGDLEQAEKLIRESITLMEQNGDRMGLAVCLGKLGETLIGLGRFQEVQEPLQSAQALHHELGLTEPAAFIAAIQALALMHQGDYAEAQRHVEPILAHFQAVRSRRGRAYALLILGWAALARNATVQAQEQLEQSLALYHDLGQQDELGQAHALLALIAHCHHNTAEAQIHLQQAQQIAETIQAFMPRLLALTVQVRLYRDQAEPTLAMWYYSQIAHHPLVATSRWFADLLTPAAKLH
ncbi:MAG: tetratricopeptide repeat protein [Caldilineaceae bacterium]|nr:tetratricopeptide repeat protein [Caldilineaceae bacterium]